MDNNQQQAANQTKTVNGTNTNEGYYAASNVVLRKGVTIMAEQVPGVLSWGKDGYITLTLVKDNIAHEEFKVAVNQIYRYQAGPGMLILFIGNNTYTLDFSANDTRDILMGQTGVTSLIALANRMNNDALWWRNQIKKAGVKKKGSPVFAIMYILVGSLLFLYVIALFIGD